MKLSASKLRGLAACQRGVVSVEHVLLLTLISITIVGAAIQIGDDFKRLLFASNQQITIVSASLPVEAAPPSDTPSGDKGPDKHDVDD